MPAAGLRHPPRLPHEQGLHLSAGACPFSHGCFCKILPGGLTFHQRELSKRDVFQLNYSTRTRAVDRISSPLTPLILVSPTFCKQAYFLNTGQGQFEGM